MLTQTERSRIEAAEANVEYLRHMYGSTRAWYTASETKAQLLLAVNGVFVTVLFGLLFGRSIGTRSEVSQFKADTWVLIGVTAMCLVGAVSCATLSLWSLHGRAEAEFAELEVEPGIPSSYRPEVLWYFGHIAHLQPDIVKDKLRTVDRQFEIDTLSYHVVDLAIKVFRKHRWVNAGWAFTALGLVALVIAGVSFFI
ncbi:MAG TPA: Pycsar system effector family protein [Trebonia sp.]|nr:Pycsar system effector family protein [Trebonia sp.]